MQTDAGSDNQVAGKARQFWKEGKDVTGVHRRGENTSGGCVESSVKRGAILPESQLSNIARVEATKTSGDFADWSAREMEQVPRHLQPLRNWIGWDDKLPTEWCRRWNRWLSRDCESPTSKGRFMCSQVLTRCDAEHWRCW
ncbi:unnamed protein product [Orchesella dallaii]|uniref:Uncharacterized protein n=1 Tax=Orchesella dallaii TaxID=48710 RepID=A0ABP1RJC9_9HEXA